MPPSRMIRSLCSFLPSLHLVFDGRSLHPWNRMLSQLGPFEHESYS
jgi:hypothetical protein